MVCKTAQSLGGEGGRAKHGAAARGRRSRPDSRTPIYLYLSLSLYIYIYIILQLYIIYIHTYIYTYIHIYIYIPPRRDACSRGGASLRLAARRLAEVLVLRQAVRKDLMRQLQSAPAKWVLGPPGSQSFSRQQS